ncbi:MAG: hypothetical protein ACYDD1_06630 [Caulobacteraceae bacterium]
MTSQAEQKRQRRFWLTVSEVVGVLALGIAALNFWESHHEHVAAEHHEAMQAQAEAAFVMTGAADSAGEKIMIDPLKSAQAIQSQRYVFPTAVLDHEMEVSAARPQIDAAWIEAGLRKSLDAAHVKTAGEARLPVGVITTYVEDGDTRTDSSIYLVGYAYRPKFLTGMKISLQGLSLGRRAVKGDLAAEVNRRWTSAHPA